MESPARNEAELSRGRLRLSWILSVVGLLLLLSGVFYLTSHAIGGRVHQFSERRPYVVVKQKAHAAYPVALLLGLSGLGLMIFGSRLRSPHSE